MSKIPAEIDPYIHKGTDVTLLQLDNFATASRATQVKVLAFLRQRAADDTVELPLFAIAIAVVMPLTAATAPATDTDVAFLARIIIGLGLGLGAGLLIGFLPGLPLFIRQERRTRATVWLRAYEDELTRRHAQRGWAARRWKARH